jgi:hypothetical protein
MSTEKLAKFATTIAVGGLAQHRELRRRVLVEQVGKGVAEDVG